MVIVPEAPNHRDRIRALLLGAFPSAAEADLVERLHADSDAVISLIALRDEQVIGQAMFSRMIAPFKALALAPVAVALPWRRQRVASRLIETGLQRARDSGWEGVFVLGDPAFYHCFGFRAGLARPFSSPYAGPHLMALALKGAALPVLSGQVRHAAAISAMG